MGIIITLVILVVGGAFIYLKFVKPQMGGHVGENYTNALKEFEESKDNLLAEYYADENRFGLFKQVIPDEQILGIASYLRPKSIGKSLLGEVKTGVTGVKKVDMGAYYMVITDKNFHCISFNGEASFDHMVFEVKEMKNVEIKKGGRDLKDQITGQTGALDKLTFTYKDESYSFNLYKTMVGYPRFEVTKDFNGQLGYVYFYQPSQEKGMKAYTSKEYQIDNMIKDSLYQGFKAEMEKDFRVQFPA